MPGKIKKRSWDFATTVRGLDKFGQPVPSFKIAGEKTVNTFIGGVITSAIYLIVLSYAVGKMLDLYKRKNPIISDNTLADYYGTHEPVNMGDFKIAVAVRGDSDGQIKNDPRYIKWIARMRNFEGGESETPMPLHECSESDLEKFYPLDKNSQKLYDDLKISGTDLFMCFDMSKELVFMTDWNQHLEINLVPCNYIHPDP